MNSISAGAVVKFPFSSNNVKSKSLSTMRPLFFLARNVRQIETSTIKLAKANPTRIIK